jgi:WD40 repeat protein
MVRAIVSVDEGRRAMDDVTRTAAGSVGDGAAEGSVPGVAASSARARVPAPLRKRDRDRYEIRGEQGRGGLGLVLRAHDRELGRDVAVKELLTRGNASELRFFREALITSRLEHPGIVPVHEAGRWSDGTPFYTMKLVGGRSLHALIADQRTLEGRLAFLPNVIAVADAIAYAHDRGVIHRDLKPSNVMVGDFGETIVIDWGLAKVLDETDGNADDVPYRSPARNELTAVGSVLGTPAYMAPEQYGGRATHLTDIYALGGILHHLLTGRPPHDRGGPQSSEPDSRYPRKTPTDLIAIVRRALARDPTQRYQGARAFADDLKRFSRRDVVSARRYSVPARLALAFARHRAVALVMMTALVALTVTFGIALYNVRREQAHTIAARETAVAASAAAMLERDPTRAWETLKSLPHNASPPLLRARIQAAGVADLSVKLPGRFDRMQVVADGQRVVVSTGERKLYVLDVRTGRLTEIADGLTEPVYWSATEDRVYFVRQTSHLSIATVSIDGGNVVELAPLAELPSFLQASERGAFWLTPDGILEQGAPGKAPRVVATHLDKFRVFGSQLATCSEDRKLRLGDTEQELPVVGECTLRSAFDADENGFIHSSRERVYTYSAGQLRAVAIPAADVFRYGQLTDTGLVVGIGTAGDGLLLRPGSDTVEHVRLSGRPLMFGAMGRLALWGLSDGAVEVLDTVDGRHWTIQAMPGQPRCTTFLSRDRLITCDRSEIRLWTLPQAAPKIIADLPALATNVAFDASRNALFDGIDGTAYVIKHGEKHAMAVHRHYGLSFGVAWCDREACSSAWDGRVLCTDLATGTSRVAADFRSVTPWIAEGADHCYTAAASGGVYDVRAPAAPLYKHQHEPYRLAVSGDGRYLASGDWGGDLVVFDTQAARIVATRDRAHPGRVTKVAWMDDKLISAGRDGVVRLSSASLTELRTWRFGSPVRFLDLRSGTIGVGLDDGSLWMLSARGVFEHQVAVGTAFTALAVSPDGAFVAAATNDGDMVVVSANRSAAAARFEHGRVSCLGFDTNTSMFVCTPSRRVMHVPLTALSFQSNQEQNREED